MINISERQQAILIKTINLFIETNHAISSNMLSKYFNNISSATIRNELSELENLGFLTNLHSSSGRIPTNQGYRFYVDEFENIHGNSELSPSFLETNFKFLNNHIENTLTVLNQHFANTINYASIIYTPDLLNKTINKVHSIMLDTNKILFLLINSLGETKEFIYTSEFNFNKSNLTTFTNFLNSKLGTHSLSELNKVDLDEIKKELSTDSHQFVIDLYQSLMEFVQKLVITPPMVAMNMSKLLTLQNLVMLN